ncbi:MAG TPA: FG-GAP-like repeat-containing protein [Vicinamibacterales bacterium]|nr:FG-GAP-like repeat-containing protein [Vicinamibacterales bacterium]
MLTLARTAQFRSWLPLFAGTAFGLAATWAVVTGAALLPNLILTIANGQVLSGVVNVSAVADTAGLAGVRFQASGVDLAPEITTGACSITWDTRNVSDGVKTLTAIGRDSVGNIVTSTPVLVTVRNATGDTTAPSVSFAPPSSISGTVTLTASASDNVGVSSVWFTIDGVTLGAEDTTSPYAVTWDTMTAANGTHTLQAFARDASGNTAMSAPVVVSVGNRGNGVVGDFNGDGYPDLIFESTSGDLYTWFLRGGSTLVDSAPMTPSVVQADWRIVGANDFDGDGRTDLLWQHAGNGQLYVWLLNGLTLIKGVQPQSAATDWRVAGTADFNGDGKPDILWKNRATSELYVWYLNGAAFAGGGYVNPSSIGSNWRVGGLGDIDRDGDTDIVWQNTATGDLAVWYMNGLSFVRSASLSPSRMDTAWRLRSVADYDRDGYADLVWQNLQTGQLDIWFMRGTRRTREAFPGSAQVALQWTIGTGQ